MSKRSGKNKNSASQYEQILNAKYIDGDDNFDGTDGDDDSDDVQEGWWAMVPCGNSTLKT